VSVSHDTAEADCVVRTGKELLDRMAAGTANATTAALRGLVAPVGDLGLFIQFQHPFPGPPRDSADRDEAGYVRRPTGVEFLCVEAGDLGGRRVSLAADLGELARVDRRPCAF